ncbi:carbohydrate ABC transporter permease [Lysinibacter cavernae]|uniref:Raffinose/stachyose/melibiose transport system permease protein n=1 Tax=Lysinibacter cavernae TaxID=1640652 RepID=A0A7X5TTC7_9MICO|nr:carbohydrate ABC transporter permease [Lysinibacter cavernae]NIH54040.1 raffinose/stachyose/melibiose transport system permease protein [Lysinibacter cavernae]
MSQITRTTSDGNRPGTEIKTAPSEPIDRASARGKRRGPRPSLGAQFMSSTVLWVYAFIAITPLLLMLMNSFRTNQELATQPLGLPLSPDFSSYQRAWIEASFSTYFVNSLVVTIASVVLSTVVSLLAAYGLARSQSKVLQVVESIFVSGLMMPVYLMIVPIFYLLDSMGMVSTREGLILVYTAVSIPFSVFVLGAFFRQLPLELEEAARIDGAGPFRIFWAVMVPLVRPAIATVIIFRFVPIWNDFFYPLILIRDPSKYTLPVGLTSFFGEYQTDWSTLFAGLVIATLPLIVLFLLATKQIVAGLTAGMGK